MDKSPDAFRTISEVAEVLDTPAHVLRFWESRFPQIRPVKRAGGRRYYRPADVALLMGIRHLLHDEGLTIRGVQKILREQGIRHVSDLSGQTVSDEAESAETALEAALAANFGIRPPQDPMPPEQIETAQVVALEGALRQRALESTPPEEPAEVLPLFDTFAMAEPEPMPEPMPEPSAEPALVAEPQFAPEYAPEPAPIPVADVATPDDPADLLPSTADALANDASTAPLADPAPDLPQDTSLLARLRALPPGSLAAPEARALRDRLAALGARVSAVSPPSLP